MIDPRGNVPDTFERVTREHGERSAIAGGAWEPTYQELDQVSNGLAWELFDQLESGSQQWSTSATGRAQETIALLMSHDSPLFMAMLAVWKAGRIVVVLNPQDPLARLESILDESSPSLILCDARHETLARRMAKERPTLLVDSSVRASTEHPLPRTAILWNDVACLVHTSGSTGRPKGVMRTHGQILDCARRVGRSWNDHDRVIALASCTTGQGQTTAWTTLLRGAVLCPFHAAERGVTGLAEFMTSQRVSVYVSSVSLFRCFVGVRQREPLPDVRVVRLASEPPTLGDLRACRDHFAPGCRFINAISSSETGVIADWPIDLADEATTRELFSRGLPDSWRLPVGTPVDGVDLRLVDEEGADVAEGEAGEVVVRSPYFAAGYWRDPALTAQRFSFDPTTQMTVFRSGDVLRRDADGRLVFAGRRDARLKIRGYRVEPADIEHVLHNDTVLGMAVVGAVKGPSPEPLLVAYYTGPCRTAPEIESVRQALRTRLPDYMIPARFIQIDMFPLTGSGKIDRHELFCRSLPIAEPDPLQDAPTTETEQQLARIWQRVFHRDRIGRDSHFFELGGDSLLAAVVAAHVHADSGIELPLRLVSDHPTLRDLALAMTNLPRTSPHQENGPPVSPLPRDEPLPMSFAQEWIWQECMTQSSADGWSTVQRHRLLGPLQTDLLVKGIGTIFQRHEILRTTFSLHGTQPKAIVHASIDPPLEVLDLSHEDDPSARANEIVRRQLRESPFDVRRLPLARFWLVKVGAEEHLLFRAIHHVIVDAWSWKIFFNELTQIYSSLRLGRPHALPPAPQYVDYAARQRATMDKDSLTFQRAVDWWEQQFHGHPRTLRLPFQRTRPDPHAHPSEGIREYPIPPAISARLEQLAIRMGVTPFSIRVAVLAAALAEIVHQREFAFGMYTTGRHRLDLQNTFGMFANLMTLRLRWEPKRSFLDWVRIVHETIAQAREHAELPYQVLCDALRQRGRSWPVIEAIITTTDRFVPSAVADLTFSPPERLVDQMPWGFSLSVVQYAGDRWRCEFDVGRYDPIKVDVFLRRCESLFDGLTARPTEPMSAIMRPDGVSLAQAIRDALRAEVFPGWFDVMRSFKSRSKGIARRSLAMLLPVRRTLSRSVGLFGQRRRHSNYG